MSPWSVYIVRCRDRSLYTGVSPDVTARVASHNRGKGAAYTRSHGPVELVWTEEAGTRSQATMREIQIKRLTKTQKEVLIQSESPTSKNRHVT